MSSENSIDGERLSEMLRGYQVTQLLHVLVALGVPDRLAAGPRRVAELAELIGADRDALARVLRPLAQLGVLRDEHERGYSLTTLGSRLRSGVAQSQQPAALTYGQNWWWRPWGELLDVVRTGRTAFATTYGSSFFEFLGEHPDAAAVFNANMTEMSSVGADAIVDACDLAAAHQVVDVGGGHATMANAIIARHPTVNVVVYDQPSVVAGLRPPADPAMASRLQAVGGDFFRDAPPEGDTYIVKDILHDWDDDQCVTILRTIRGAAPAHGRLLVVERILEEDTADTHPTDTHPTDIDSSLVDITMLVMTGGRERTGSQYAALLAAAGWDLVEQTPTATTHSVLHARVAAATVAAGPR